MSTETKKVNPLLNRVVLPGETFALRSLGLFYTNGELDESVENGELHVHPMSTYDEVLLRSADMAYSGKAVQEVFSRCIPQIKDPMKLLAKDVDYLLACLRVVTYGPTMDVVYNHRCKGDQSKQHTYEVNIRSLVAQAKKIDPTTLESVFQKKLDNGQVVKFKPIVFEDMIAMDQALFALDENVSEKELSNQILKALANVIGQVDEITDKELIFEWLETLPAGWIKELTTGVQDISNWGITFNVDLVCKDCGETVTVELWTNPLTFFN